MATNSDIKVRLLLYRKGKILLLKQTKRNGGNYTLVGGNVDPGEGGKAALIREAHEEAGIQLQAEDLKLAHTLHKRIGKNQRVTLYFKAAKFSGEIRSKEPKKFAKVEWCPLDQLPANLTNTVRHVLRAYRHGKFYSEFKKNVSVLVE